MKHVHPIAAVFGALAIAATLLGCETSDGDEVALPGGDPGIGFDDLRYSAGLDRVLAPGGRSGQLYLIDPESMAVTTLGGFSSEDEYDGGHDFGLTSVDEGEGMLFLTDRTSRTLYVVEPSDGTILGSAALAGGPDYVRWVAATREIWVTEPSRDQLEIFSLPEGAHDPMAVETIPVDNGPESLVIDQEAGRAYTHRWQASTLVIDVASREVLAEWSNGCAASRGLALDVERGFFFADCSEGTVNVLDSESGAIISSEARGAGFDVMGYDEKLGHLYVAGGSCGCLVVLGVSGTGELSFLDRFEAPSSTHCATADQHGHAWVCDPDDGSLWRVEDGAEGEPLMRVLALMALVCIAAPAGAEERRGSAGVQLGWAFPLGSTEEGAHLADGATGAIPITLDVEGQATELAAFGALLSYAPVVPTLCASGAECISSIGGDIMLAARSRFTLPDLGPLRPRVGLGLGWEWLKTRFADDDTDVSRSYHGPLPLLVDVALMLEPAPRFALGFVGTGALGIFVERKVALAAGDADLPSAEVRPHGWLDLGIRFAVEL